MLFINVKTELFSEKGFAFSKEWYDIADMQSIDRKNRSQQILNLLKEKEKDALKNEIDMFNGKKEIDGLRKTEEILDGKTLGITRKAGNYKFELPVYSEYYHEGNGSSARSINRYIEQDIEVPREIAASNELCIKWEGILKKMPSAKDAVSSPNKDLLIVLTTSELLVFTYPERGLSQPALKIPVGNDEKIILTQWATGDYVKKWTQNLSCSSLEKCNYYVIANLNNSFGRDCYVRRLLEKIRCVCCRLDYKFLYRNYIFSYMGTV